MFVPPAFLFQKAYFTPFFAEFSVVKIALFLPSVNKNPRHVWRG
jgi:hypothetical protein